jgi:hypothetical protein
MFLTLTELHARGYGSEALITGTPQYAASGRELFPPPLWTEEYKAMVDHALLTMLRRRRAMPVELKSAGIRVELAEWQGCLAAMKERRP